MTLYIGSKPTAPGVTGIFGALWQDSTGSLNWKDLYGNNIVLGAGGGGTSGGIGGTGTSNHIPRFTNASTIGNSIIYQYSDSRIGINTTSPVYPLHVRGKNECAIIECQFDHSDQFGELTVKYGTTYMGGFTVVGPSYYKTQWRNSLILTAANNNSGSIIFRTKTSGTYYERLKLMNNGNVGIGCSPSYTLDVDGDIHCTGKITSDGGNDPKYVHYEANTRDNIISLVKREIPTSKLNGAVLFYNTERDALEIFIPNKGIFKDILGSTIHTIDPITETFELKYAYYFDKYTGSVRKQEILEKRDGVYNLKDGYEIDNHTGSVYKIETLDEEGKETNRILVDISEAVEFVPEVE